MRRRNPFPGVTRLVDRHGKVRWRFRRKTFTCYLPGPYAGVDFRSAYEAAIASTRTPAVYDRFPHGSLNWLIESYLRSSKHRNKSASTRRVLSLELEWLRHEAGDLPIKSFRARHVEALMARKSGPAAANKVRKNLSLLFTFAIKQEAVAHNPARAADTMQENGDGFHTWTDAEMQTFLACHGPGTKARLVFLLARNTGAARVDICRLGWSNIKSGRIAYRRSKSGVGGEYTILPDLAGELDRLPRNSVVLVTHGDGLPYKPETLGMWFKQRCLAAGLPHCTLHGIRKGQATKIVNEGGTPDEVMAYLAHKTNAEGSTYTKKADRGRLADSALARISGAKPEQNLSNLPEKLDKNSLK